MYSSIFRILGGESGGHGGNFSAGERSAGKKWPFSRAQTIKQWPLEKWPLILFKLHSSRTNSHLTDDKQLYWNPRSCDPNYLVLWYYHIGTRRRQRERERERGRDTNRQQTMGYNIRPRHDADKFPISSGIVVGPGKDFAAIWIPVSFSSGLSR